MDLLHQLGELFLAAVPTAIVVFLFYLFLRWSFFRPLQQVLAERRARAEVFAEQEATRRVALEERSKVIQQARSRATDEVQAGKARLGEEIGAAQKALETSAQQLA